VESRIETSRRKLLEGATAATFDGPKNNRLYMASSHSLYALYVEAHAPCRSPDQASSEFAWNAEAQGDRARDKRMD
jgi:hypothetical protein